MYQSFLLVVLQTDKLALVIQQAYVQRGHVPKKGVPYINGSTWHGQAAYTCSFDSLVIKISYRSQSLLWYRQRC